MFCRLSALTNVRAKITLVIDITSIGINQKSYNLNNDDVGLYLHSINCRFYFK